jgi:hypothetical protein
MARSWIGTRASVSRTAPLGLQTFDDGPNA